MATAPVTDTSKYRIHLLNPIDAADDARHRAQAGWFLREHYPDEYPAKGTDYFLCRVEVVPGITLTGMAWGNHVFVGCEEQNWHDWLGTEAGERITADTPFFSARMIKGAYTKVVKKQRQVRRRTWGGWEREAYEGVDTYDLGRWDAATGAHATDIPYAYFTIEVTSEGAEPVVGEFKFKQPQFGTAILSPNHELGEVTITTDFFGLTRSWTENLARVTHRYKRENWSRDYYEEYPNNPLQVLFHHLRDSECPDGADAWWATFLKHNRLGDDQLDTRGLKALLKRKAIKPVLDRLQEESPVNWEFFRWLFNGRTKNKVKVNTLLSVMLKTIGTDYDALNKALTEARTAALTVSTHDGYAHTPDPDRWLEAKQAIAQTLPGGKERIQEQQAKEDWRKRKTAAGKADGLGITAETTPKLRKAVEDGHIPATVFDQPDNNPVNREYTLWEKALKRKGWAEVLYKIADDAGRRNTYDKDITPYISFLFKIEKYLDRHTEGRKKWRAMPKYVESQWELEMEDATEDGTTKQRSAFTPVADNETRTVTIPYVAVVVGGRMAQWCYSQHYYVFEEGAIDAESGGVIVNELEEKLNGRDDYGLMYFTLTGTVTARGYPTFLIIFERLQGHGPVNRNGDAFPKTKTRVHFHRVHPKRRTKGKKTPACQLINKCYQYMAGNIPASDIEAQQGDLIFIRHGNDPIEAGAKVAEPQEAKGIAFESHAMLPLFDGDAKMKLYDSEAKTPKNRLGFLWSPGSFAVKHPEHDDIEHLDEGWWEIRRCRSWEANPKAIWSLTID